MVALWVFNRIRFIALTKLHGISDLPQLYSANGTRPYCLALFNGKKHIFGATRHYLLPGRDHMLTAFTNYIAKQKLFQPHQPVLLAVSGGLDSVVLGHLLCQSQQPFAVAHCNYGLRGAESDGDAHFVQQLAGQWGVACHSISFNTQAIAARQGASTQMVARNLRYAWFKRLCQGNGYACVATAHHLDDSLETTLFNLAKGTGIAGVRGIPAKNHQVVRPLLFASRAAITQYAQAAGLSWREDSSNSSDYYHRNRLRHHVVPVLRQINPNLSHTLSHTYERLQAAEAALNTQTNQLKAACLSKQGDDVYLDITALPPTPHLPTLLHELLKPWQFSYTQCRDLSQSLQHPTSGKQFYSQQYVLTVDRAQLIISPVTTEALVHITIVRGTTQVKGPGFTIGISTHPKSSYQISRKPTVAALDADKLQWPLQLRPWQQGDRFKPLGMTHYKKLSDFMIDQKIPVNLKSKVYVLVSGQHIVWVVGHRIDNRYALGPGTTTVLEANCRSND